MTDPTQELKAEDRCPFCGESETPFQNLRDDPEDEYGIIKCWTIIHACPTIFGELVVEGATEQECASKWAIRTPDTAQLLKDKEELETEIRNIGRFARMNDFAHPALIAVANSIENLLARLKKGTDS